MLEKVVGRSLQREGFLVHANPGIARPRQTDLVATSPAGVVFLFEVKWEARKIGIAELAEIRDRLRRGPADVIGVVVSMGGFARSLYGDIERDRTREVLAVEESELLDLLKGRYTWGDLLAQKRNQLRIHGRAEHHVTAPRHPQVQRVFEMAGARSLTLPCPGMIGDAGFTWSHQTAGGGAVGGPSIYIQMDVGAGGHKDLGAVFRFLETRLGTVSPGSFAISQTGFVWHGFGPKEFLSQLRNWKPRYEAVGLKAFHHSESGAYFTEVLDGVATIYVVHSVGGSRHEGFTRIELYLDLPSLPLDLAPLSNLARELGARRPTMSWLPADRDSRRLRLERPLELEVRGRVLSSELELIGESREWVCGIVVENPLFATKPTRGARTHRLDFPLSKFEETPWLICALDDWFLDDDVTRTFYLSRLEAVHCGESVFLRPTAIYESEAPLRAEPRPSKRRQH